MTEELRKCDSPLKQLREFLSDPPLQCNSHIADPAWVAYDDSSPSPFFIAEVWLTASCRRELRRNDVDRALDDFVAVLALCRMNGDDLTLEFQQKRSSIIARAANLTEALLASPDLDERQLSKMQQAWSGIQVVDRIGQSIEQHRAEVVYILENAQHWMSYQQYKERVLHGAFQSREPIGRERFLDFPAWQWINSYRDEGEFLKGFQPIIRMFRGAMDPKTKLLSVTNVAWRQFHREAAMAFLEFNTIGTWRGGEDFDRYARASFILQGPTFTHGPLNLMIISETEKELAVAAIALRRFHIRNGNFPLQLEQLVPVFLQKPALDYMTGKPLHYQLKNDGTFVLYAVGTDGVDDGGDATGPVGQPHDIVWSVPGNQILK
jgi:hypothetical protein